ncbi:TylF/MycF/NovP-related O-methyltransferase [Nitratidesulfovibrio sp. 1201_IL3209]|uniref:TylF/MycF/NovP-related O-methyltransferase n=1 Tax=Nitratidesulfovibrio sp. 1201_IL3209 TaxID=3084053 RepID=UPI002FDB09AE
MIPRYAELSKVCFRIRSVLKDLLIARRGSQHILQELQRCRSAYLDIIQQCLTGSLYKDASCMNGEEQAYNHDIRETGWDWPKYAHTMIGRKRLENLRLLTESILGNGVPGDLIEAGVWRGGACILMRAVLHAYNVTDRRVWVADSFEGLPAPDESAYPADSGSTFHEYPELSVSFEEVQSNFNAYGLLDKQVVFLNGWFKNTLKTPDIERLALIRLDGDMYESTMDGLVSLYPKLSVGGYIIIDDYHVVQACKQAVHDYCTAQGLTPAFSEIDGVGIYWKKEHA